MCIIAVKNAGIKIWPDATIRTMFARNQDGAGVMWAEDNKVHIKKGFMTVEPLLEFLHSRDWTGVPFILHCRIGTSGGKTPLNCHPYPVFKKNFVEGTCSIAMAHNGVLYSYNPTFGSKINDTQVFINEIIDKMPKKFLRNKALKKLIAHEASPSRLAFLEADGTITLMNEWIKDGDYWYSNRSFEPVQTSSWSKWTNVTNTWSKQKPAHQGALKLDKTSKEAPIDDWFMPWDETNPKLQWADLSEAEEDCLTFDQLFDYLKDFKYDPKNNTYTSKDSPWTYMVEDYDCVRWPKGQKKPAELI